MFCSCNVQLAHKKNHKKVLTSLETNKLRIKIKNVFSKQTFCDIRNVQNPSKGLQCSKLIITWCKTNNIAMISKECSHSVKSYTVRQFNNNMGQE